MANNDFSFFCMFSHDDYDAFNCANRYAVHVAKREEYDEILKGMDSIQAVFSAISKLSKMEDEHYIWYWICDEKRKIAFLFGDTFSCSNIADLAVKYCEPHKFIMAVGQADNVMEMTIVSKKGVIAEFSVKNNIVEMSDNFPAEFAKRFHLRKKKVRECIDLANRPGFKDALGKLADINFDLSYEMINENPEKYSAEQYEYFSSPSQSIRDPFSNITEDD